MSGSASMGKNENREWPSIKRQRQAPDFNWISIGFQERDYF